MTSRRYRLQSTNTFAAVIVRNDDRKLLSRLGHDHVVRAQEFTSTVALDSEHPETLRFALDFPVHQLVVDDADDRARVGLDGSVSQRDRDATRQNMLAKGQLHADRFGTIGFRVDGAHIDDDGDWILESSLNIHQRRFEFEFPVSVTLSPNLCVDGRIELTHDDLGLTPYKAPMGTLRNREELVFVVEIDAAPL